MSPEKWRYFGIALVAFVLVAVLMIVEQGGLGSLEPAGFAILFLAFAAIGVLLYFYVKGRPEDRFRD